MSKEASLEKSVGKELSIEQDKYLKDLYYDKPFPFGRDKLFAYVKENNPEIKLSRRQIDIWLKKQEIHQVHYRKKPLREIKSVVVDEPRKIIQLDIADLGNLAKNDIRYLLVAIDMSSRRIYLETMKSRKDENIVKAFQGIHKRIPTLKTVRSDNEFKNQKYKKFLESINVTPVYGRPSFPQSQSQVERSNQTIKRIISKSSLYKDNFDWTTKENVNKIETAFNNTINKTTGKTPIEIEKLYDETPRDKKKEFSDNVLDKARLYYYLNLAQ